MNNNTTPPNLNLLLDVPVAVTVELGSCTLPMREVLQLAVGSVIQLETPPDAPVEVRVNNRRIAKGEVVVVDNRYGIKITELA
ncbi:MAG TPA: flagellar motor switch protein FliN [Methylomirabilota bacterium]|nr:flagellar motor switch protein FliN [Methylomirabilota bacterium]